MMTSISPGDVYTLFNADVSAAGIANFSPTVALTGPMRTGEHVVGIEVSFETPPATNPDYRFQFSNDNISFFEVDKSTNVNGEHVDIHTKAKFLRVLKNGQDDAAGNPVTITVSL